MPIYKTNKKKNGLQGYRVCVNYTDSTGKYRSIERTAYGKSEAQELETKLKIELKESTSRRMTLNELSKEFLDVKKYEVRETSIDKMRRRLNYYILPHLGEYRIDKLNTPVLQKWKTAVEEMKTSTDKPLSLRTKQSAYCELRSVLNYAVKMEYLSKNPLLSVGNFKDAYATPPKIDFYTSDEFKKFITAAKKAAEKSEKQTGSIYEWNFYIFFVLAFYTGMRKGEIYALTWNDVKKNTIHITKSISQKLKGEDRETPPKNKSSVRDIKIPVHVQNILKTHLKRSKSVSGFKTTQKICGGEKCIRDTSVENHNKTYAEAAGLKKIRIHDFRHSHASLLANNGINIQEIARRLGHSKIEITWNTYSHLYPQEEDRAVSILEKIK